ncbi:MAG: methyltransferase [Vicinamibacteria bacterium]|nr:methyltransferase [Vicinamibacteria bacterium]
MSDDGDPVRGPRAGSRARLTPRSATLFRGDGLFDRVARTLCAAGCVPRKELYEAWEVARRVRRRFRGGRVVDLACGHGLLAHLMLLLDDSSPAALAVDRRLPPSAAKAAEALCNEWPRLRDRVCFLEAPLGEVALAAGDVVVSAHACGALTDAVLERAVAAGARVAVLPCCQAKGLPAASAFAGWLDPALAVDVARVAWLEARGYAVHTQLIPPAVTPKNRLLLAAPRDSA